MKRLHFGASCDSLPEPMTMFLGGTGLAALAYAARKRLRHQGPDTMKLHVLHDAKGQSLGNGSQRRRKPRERRR